MRRVAGVSSFIDRLRHLLTATWAGVLLCVALIATPAPFAVLPVAQAGQVVGRILAQEAWVSLAMAVVLLLLERGSARRIGASAAQGSSLSTEILLLLGTAFCTLAGYFGIQPMLVAARQGQGGWTFGQLHAVSTALFGVKTLLVLALAWRLSASRLRPATPSS